MLHNGYYTLISPSGEHRTFRIETQSEKESFCPGKRIISLLVGPQNTSDYKGFGFVTDQGIRVWKKYQGSGSEKSFHEKCAMMLWSLVQDGAYSPYRSKGARYEVEEHCLRCNRLLTTPESIARGMGPECASKM